MGVKRPLKPQVVAKYGAELSQAEKMAKIGYDPKTKRLNENIYGPTTAGSFSLAEEMKALQENNIIEQQNLGEHNSMPQNKISNALDAIQQEDPNFDPAPVAMDNSAPINDADLPEKDEQGQEPKEKKEEPPRPPTLEEVAEQIKIVAGPNAPSADQLRGWKQMYGNIFVLMIDDYVFIYRYLIRQEWKQILAKSGWDKSTQEQQEDFIAAKCTLWPRFTAETEGRFPAGTAQLIAEQVRINSLFLDPAAVANITIKL